MQRRDIVVLLSRWTVVFLPASVGSTGAAARRWLAARHGSVRAPMSEPY